MAYTATAIRAAAAGIGGTASVVAFLSAIEANPHYDVGATITHAIVLVLPFAIYIWLVRTRKRSIQLGVVLCLVTACWIVLGYGSLRTTDDGLGFMAPYLALIATFAVAVLGGLYDRLARRPPNVS
jgi:hypothetical protein